MKTKSILFYLMQCLFLYQNTQASNIYFNDNSNTGYIFCTAVGNNTISGLNPSTPKSTLSALPDIVSSREIISIKLRREKSKALFVSILHPTIKGAHASKIIFENAEAILNFNLLMTMTSDKVFVKDIDIAGYNNDDISVAASKAFMSQPHF
jgi:hypothetical protein